MPVDKIAHAVSIERKADPSANQPVGINEFSRLLNDLQPSGKPYKPAALAVAVSGGGDSMALTLLAARWARRRKIPFYALTVDHGLRRGSGAEARAVGDTLKKLGISHKVLRWQGNKPTANIQAAAREARYDLLLAWCLKHRVPDLLLAHHLDDQAETVLLRLIRGSGVDGLSAMSAVREMAGVRLLRPLLAVAQSRLQATCRDQGQDWIEDPSNQNTDFARIQVRTLLADMAPLGLEANRLAQTARHMARARQALESQTDRLAASLVQLDEFAVAGLDRQAFSSLSEELALRLLRRCLMTIGGGPFAPRFERLARLCHLMMDKGFQGRRTLAGCQIVATGPCFRIFREYRHLPAVAVKPGQVLLWDNRFRVEIKLPKGGVRKDLMVEPMGPAGWKAYGTLQQNNETAELRTRLAGLPAAARYALPVIRHKQALIALPWPEKAAKRPDFMFPAAFSPRNPLIHESFPVVSPAKDIIY